MATLLHIQATATPDLSYSVRTAKAFLESYRESHPYDTVKTLDLALAVNRRVIMSHI